MYAIVENGSVTRAVATPRRIVINGYTRGPEMFGTPDGLALGIYPVSEVRPSFDPVTQYLIGPTYSVGATEVTATYVATDFDLDTVKDLATAAAREWRNAREMNPFQHNGIWHWGDADSIRRINGAVTLAQIVGPSFSETWSSASGVDVTLDQAGMLGLGAAKAQQISAVFASCRTAVTAIDSAVTAQACRDAVTAFKASQKAVALLDFQAWAQHQAFLAGGGVADPYTTYVQL